MASQRLPLSSFDVAQLTKPKVQILTCASTSGDAASQRSAMQELRRLFNSQHLNQTTLPIFIDLLIGTLDSNGSSLYYIHVPTHSAQPCPLAIAIARLTAHLLHSASTKQIRLPLPCLNRILTSLVSWLQLDSCTTRSLHIACAKLISALATAVAVPDSPESAASNVFLLRVSTSIDSTCRSLLNALASRIEPVSIGAATCLQAFIETPIWKFHASYCSVSDVCRGAAAALNARPSYNVDSAHIDLVSELTKRNSSRMEEFAAGLLSKAMEIIRLSSEWKERAASAVLAERLLCLLSNIVVLGDCADVALEMESLKNQVKNALLMLKEYRHDKATVVRSAVSKALKVASANGQQTPVAADNCDDSYYDVTTPLELTAGNLYVTPLPALQTETACVSYVASIDSRNSSSSSSCECSVTHDVDDRHAASFDDYGLDNDVHNKTAPFYSASSAWSMCSSPSASEEVAFVYRRNSWCRATSMSSDNDVQRSRPSTSDRSTASGLTEIGSGNLQGSLCTPVDAATPERVSSEETDGNYTMSDTLQFMKCETPAVPRCLISRFNSIQQEQGSSELMMEHGRETSIIRVSNGSGLSGQLTTQFDIDYNELDYLKPEDEPADDLNITAPENQLALINHRDISGDGDSVNLENEGGSVTQSKQDAAGSRSYEVAEKAVPQTCSKSRQFILMQQSNTAASRFSCSTVAVIVLSVFVFLFSLFYCKYSHEHLESRSQFLRPT